MELKEFLYVDVDRVRSLLSQMAGGFIEAVKKSTTADFTAGAQAVILGMGGKGDYKHGSQYEEARSFQDLTFVAFEQLANENGMIMDFPGELMDPEAWEGGEVHNSLLPSQLLRIECEVQLLDGGFFRTRLKRFVSLAEGVADTQAPQAAPKSAAKSAPNSANAKTAKKERDERVRQIMSGATPEAVDAMARVIEAFAGDSVLLRILPCGAEHLEYGFTGALLGRREYIQEERENLFSRYGQAPTVWTSVVQVAAIPERPLGPATFNAADGAPPGGWSRAHMEKMAGGFLGYMEQLGIVEGPRWPSISVTPLGLYRTVPPAP